jgi:hypothetical protein
VTTSERLSLFEKRAFENMDGIADDSSKKVMGRLKTTVEPRREVR